MSRLDILAPDFRADPYPHYARLRDEAAAVQVDPFGLWIVTRYHDVVDVLRRTQDFSSTGNRRAAANVAAGTLPEGRDIISIDNPDHDRLRSIMQKRFTPRKLASLQTRVEQLAARLISDISTSQSFDYVESFAVPLPVIVIAELLGVEADRIGDFKRWSNALVQMVNGTSPELVAEARVEVRELALYLSEVAGQRRSQVGDGVVPDDLIGLLVAAEQEPGRISGREVVDYCVLLLAAGNETTTNLIGGLALALLDHPDQLARLSADPSLIPNAVEEGVRYCAPVQGLFRRARHDTMIDDVRIPEGAEIMICYAAANHDPKRFPDPERFDIERDCSGHVGFGWGLHFCLGANLARREARIALEASLPLLAESRRDSSEIEWVDSWFLRGPKHLPLSRGS